MASINFLVKQGEKLVESSLLKKSTTVSIKDLRYAPKQLTTDIVELTQKSHPNAKVLTKEILEPLVSSGKKMSEITEILGVSSDTVKKYLKQSGLYKPARVPNTLDKIERARLQELVDKGLSLHQIASELGVKVGKVRIYLDKYNIISDAQNEFRILKRYFSATTQEEKAKAFSEIDKHLEQIAKEEFKLKKETSYEDCLQDVRLRFFETVDESQKKGISFPSGILKTMRNAKPVLNQEIKTVELGKCDIGIADEGIEMFESNNYENFLWNYLRNNMKKREPVALEKYIREDKSTKEIASSFGLTVSQTRNILNDALSNLKEQFKIATSKEVKTNFIKKSQ